MIDPKIKLIAVYHIGPKDRGSFTDDYAHVINGDPLQWRYIDEEYATVQGIREWSQHNWPSHASVWADNSHQLVYYTFMPEDRMLIILL